MGIGFDFLGQFVLKEDDVLENDLQILVSLGVLPGLVGVRTELGLVFLFQDGRYQLGPKSILGERGSISAPAELPVRRADDDRSLPVFLVGFALALVVNLHGLTAQSLALLLFHLLIGHVLPVVSGWPLDLIDFSVEVALVAVNKLEVHFVFLVLGLSRLDV